MGLIARAAKTGTSATTYLGAKTAGAVPLQVADLDIDFATLYTEINGQLDNANVATSAAIEYSKLDLTNSIVNTDIVDNTIRGVKLANQPNGVTATKINIGATLFANDGDTDGTDDPDTTDVELTPAGTELLVSELNPTIRGTTGFYIAVIHGFVTLPVTVPASAAFTARLRIGGTTAVATDGTVTRATSVNCQTSGGGDARDTPFTIVIPVLLTGLTPGAQIIKLTWKAGVISSGVEIHRSYKETWFLEWS